MEHDAAEQEPLIYREIVRKRFLDLDSLAAAQDSMRKAGLLADVIIYNTTISACAKAGPWQLAAPRMNLNAFRRVAWFACESSGSPVNTMDP